VLEQFGLVDEGDTEGSAEGSFDKDGNDEGEEEGAHPSKSIAKIVWHAGTY
jgi:hypothetical protein